MKRRCFLTRFSRTDPWSALSKAPYDLRSTRSKAPYNLRSTRRKAPYQYIFKYFSTEAASRRLERLRRPNSNPRLLSPLSGDGGVPGGRRGGGGSSSSSSSSSTSSSSSASSSASSTSSSLLLRRNTKPRPATARGSWGSWGSWGGDIFDSYPLEGLGLAYNTGGGGGKSECLLSILYGGL